MFVGYLLLVLRLVGFVDRAFGIFYFMNLIFSIILELVFVLIIVILHS